MFSKIIKLPNLAVFAICLVFGVLLANYFDVFHSGFSGSDESSHFVNSYFIWDFLKTGSYSNPLKFAEEFYAEFPKLAIGHWPPLYYLFISAVFFVFPAAPETVMWVNLLVSLAPVLLISCLVLEVADWRWALLAGIAYVLLPISLSGLSFFMLDQPVTLICILAVLAWRRYANQPSYAWSAAYGIFAAAAILVKGNGWLLGLFPVFHIIFSRNWSLLTNVRTYAGAALCLLVVFPWYFITAKISADGFNYAFGIDFAITALTTNLGTLVANLGLLGTIFVVTGVILALRNTEQDSTQHQLAMLSVSFIFAVLSFQSLVPVDIVDRYLMPAIPFAVILTIMGMLLIGDLPWLKARPGVYRTFLPLAVSLLFYPGLLVLIHERPQSDMRMAEAAEEVVGGKAPQVVVIDGSPAGEGAFIAEALVKSQSDGLYVVRSSMLFSASDFMGKRYSLLAETDAEVEEKLRWIGAQAIVIERRQGGNFFPHNFLLKEYLESSGSHYRKANRLDHRNRTGWTEVYVAKANIEPDVEAVLEVNYPKKKPTL